MTDKTPEFIEPGSEPVSAKKTAAKTEAHPDAKLTAADLQYIADGIMTEAEILDAKAKARAEIMADKKTKLKAEILTVYLYRAFATKRPDSLERNGIVIVIAKNITWRSLEPASPTPPFFNVAKR